MIKVWTDAAEAGLLDRFGARAAHSCTSPAAYRCAVSVDHAVVCPLDIQYGLPIFEMNCEGMLRTPPSPLQKRLAPSTNSICWPLRPLQVGRTAVPPEGAVAGGRTLSVGR